VQEIAKEVCVADQRDELDDDGRDQQRPGCFVEKLERLFGADEFGEEQIDAKDDDEEDDDSSQRLDRDPPRPSSALRPSRA
jgi:hypothetical protein